MLQSMSQLLNFRALAERHLRAVANCTYPILTMIMMMIMMTVMVTMFMRRSSNMSHGEMSLGCAGAAICRLMRED
jgi:hypothetical protein